MQLRVCSRYIRIPGLRAHTRGPMASTSQKCNVTMPRETEACLKTKVAPGFLFYNPLNVSNGLWAFYKTCDCVID